MNAPTPQYDFIFAGGGLAGLSLAYRLATSPLRDSTILIVDRDDKTRDDRTWCFWTTQPTPFQNIVKREWRQLYFAGENFAKTIPLGSYRYQLVRGLDFYRFVRHELSEHSNVEFAQGNVETLQDAEDGARVNVDGKTYAGRWVFDSRFNLKDFRPNHKHYHYLPQYFRGWEIETPQPVFDPSTVTWLDFRTPQKQAMRFFYVLPFSECRALVEYVTLGPDRYDQALDAYIENILGIQKYRRVAIEGGVNPMSDLIFPRQASLHVMNIGTRGGRIKPSTGYAFLRIQQDSAAIVRSLIRCGHPFDVPPDSRRYRYFDALMLHVMQHHGAEIKPLFTALVKNNPIGRVLRFLDEQASLEDNSRIIASLPPKLFLEAMVRIQVNRFLTS